MPGFSNRLGRVQVAASVQMSIRARELRATSSSLGRIGFLVTGSQGDQGSGA